MKTKFLFSLEVEGHHKDEHIRVIEDNRDDLFLFRVESFLNEMRSAYCGSLAHKRTEFLNPLSGLKK